MKPIFYSITKLLKSNFLSFIGGICLTVFFIPLSTKVNSSSKLLLFSALALIASLILGKVGDRIFKKYETLNSALGNQLTSVKRKENWRAASDWDKKMRPSIVFVCFFTMIACLTIIGYHTFNNYKSEPGFTEELDKEKINVVRLEKKIDSLEGRLTHLEDSIEIERKHQEIKKPKED